METDATLLAERVGQFEAENKALKEENAALVKEVRRWMARVKYDSFLHATTRFLGEVLLIGAVSALVIILGHSFVRVISTPTVIDHCYVDTNQRGELHLYGNVEWGIDKDLGKYTTVSDAYEAATVLGCRVAGDASPNK